VPTLRFDFLVLAFRFPPDFQYLLAVISPSFLYRRDELTAVRAATPFLQFERGSVSSSRFRLIHTDLSGITLLAFFLIRLVPGDPIETLAGRTRDDPARHEQLRKEYGFDKPIFVQYGIYLSGCCRATSASR
jgi:hypothetical protein